jgi:hypothetical protein
MTAGTPRPEDLCEQPCRGQLSLAADDRFVPMMR